MLLCLFSSVWHAFLCIYCIRFFHHSVCCFPFLILSSAHFIPPAAASVERLRAWCIGGINRAVAMAWGKRKISCKNLFVGNKKTLSTPQSQRKMRTKQPAVMQLENLLMKFSV